MQIDDTILPTNTGEYSPDAGAVQEFMNLRQINVPLRPNPPVAFGQGGMYDVGYDPNIPDVAEETPMGEMPDSLEEYERKKKEAMKYVEKIHEDFRKKEEYFKEGVSAIPAAAKDVADTVVDKGPAFVEETADAVRIGMTNAFSGVVNSALELGDALEDYAASKGIGSGDIITQETRAPLLTRDYEFGTSEIVEVGAKYISTYLGMKSLFPAATAAGALAASMYTAADPDAENLMNFMQKYPEMSFLTEGFLGMLATDKEDPDYINRWKTASTDILTELGMGGIMAMLPIIRFQAQSIRMKAVEQGMSPLEYIGNKLGYVLEEEKARLGSTLRSQRGAIGTGPNTPKAAKEFFSDKETQAEFRNLVESDYFEKHSFEDMRRAAVESNIPIKEVKGMKVPKTSQDVFNIHHSMMKEVDKIFVMGKEAVAKGDEASARVLMDMLNDWTAGYQTFNEISSEAGRTLRAIQETQNVAGLATDVANVAAKAGARLDNTGMRLLPNTSNPALIEDMASVLRQKGMQGDQATKALGALIEAHEKYVKDYIKNPLADVMLNSQKGKAFKQQLGGKILEYMSASLMSSPKTGLKAWFENGINLPVAVTERGIAEVYNYVARDPMGVAPGETIQFVRGMMASSMKAARATYDVAFKGLQHDVLYTDLWNRTDSVDYFVNMASSENPIMKLMGNLGRASINVHNDFAYRMSAAPDVFFKTLQTAGHKRAVIHREYRNATNKRVARLMEEAVSVKDKEELLPKIIAIVEETAGIEGYSKGVSIGADGVSAPLDFSSLPKQDLEDARRYFRENGKGAWSKTYGSGESKRTVSISVDEGQHHFQSIRDQRDALAQEATQFGREMTFTNQLEGNYSELSRFMNMDINGIKPFRYLQKFVTTGANVFDQAYQRTPLIGLSSAKMQSMIAAGGAQKQQAIAKQVLGSAVFGIGAFLHDRIANTGYTMDPQTKALRDIGEWPNGTAIKIGDEIIQVDGEHPLFRVMALSNDLYELSLSIEGDEMKEAELQQAVTVAINTVAAAFTPESLAQLSGDLADIVDGDFTALKYLGKSMAAPIIPFYSLDRHIERSVMPEWLVSQDKSTSAPDRFPRDTGVVGMLASDTAMFRALTHKIREGLPWAESVRRLPLKNIFYEDVGDVRRSFAANISPITKVDRSFDEVDRELVRLGMTEFYSNKQIDPQDGVQLKLSYPANSITIRDGIRYNLTVEEYDKLKKFSAGVIEKGDLPKEYRELAEIPKTALKQVFGGETLKDSLRYQLKHDYPFVRNLMNPMRKSQMTDDDKRAAVNKIHQAYKKVGGAIWKAAHLEKMSEYLAEVYGDSFIAQREVKTDIENMKAEIYNELAGGRRGR